MEIVGLRIETYFAQRYLGEDEWEDNSKVNREELTQKYIGGRTSEKRFIFYGIDTFNQKQEITLWREYGICPSGYTEASWGRVQIKDVKSFGNMDYVPIKKLDIHWIENRNLKNEVFEVSYEGDDYYYPWGKIKVNMDLFKKTPMYTEVRNVWVFVGNFNIGKTNLVQCLDLNRATVYETDSSPHLPDVIYDDIVVKGNKYDFSLEEIDKRICGEHKLITVEFKEAFAKCIEDSTI